jgi:uncharacterized protein YjbJ (UPF0337 family)
MDWNRIEGNWKQFTGKAKQKWGKLTDDDLDVMEAVASGWLRSRPQFPSRC